MNKKELIGVISKETGLPKKEVGAMFEGFAKAVKSSLQKDEEVKISGLGVFGIRNREGRVGINPRTGKDMNISKAKVPVFRISGSFKKQLNDELGMVSEVK